MRHNSQFIENDEDFSAICLKCWSVVTDFHELYAKAEQLADQWAIMMMACEADDKKPIKIEEPTTELLTIEMVTVASSSSTGDNDDVKSECIDEDVSADENDAFNNSSSNDDDDDDDNTESSFDEPLAMHRRRITKKTAISKKHKSSKPTISNVVRLEKDTRKASSNALNRQIMEYFSLACKKCDYESVTLPQLLAHTKRAHGEEGFVECCDRKFSRRFKVLEHIEWHTNPDDFK